MLIVRPQSEHRVQMRNERRVGAVCAIGGAALLFIGTFLHPMGADPNNAVAAFAEYAADRLWVASHLVQLAGVAAMVAALFFFTGQLEANRPSSVSRIATAGAVVSLALAAALQAVDGIALKSMVDAWAAAPESEKEGLFHAAFAVRQIEIGLASMLSLSLGLTMTLYGTAVLRDEYPKWFACLAIAGGVPTMASGVVMAYTGFSGLAMTINMPASLLLMLWMLALGRFMWHPRVGQPHSEVRSNKAMKSDVE